MTRRKLWTPPRYEWSQLGPVRVEVVKDLRDEETGERLSGLALRDARRILIHRDLEPQPMRLTLAHEWLHLVLHDIGVTQIVSADADEVITNGLSVALVARDEFHAKRRR
jgi:Zn-dependent peptidase ImmA (M78 family)